MFLIVQNTNAKILGSIKEGVYFRLLMGVNNNPIYRSLCNFLVLDVPIDQRYKITRYANLFLSVDFTCRNQLQQCLSVCQFRHVCISCFYHLYNLYWIGILVSIVWTKYFLVWNCRLVHPFIHVPFSWHSKLLVKPWGTIIVVSANRKRTNGRGKACNFTTFVLNFKVETYLI